MLKKKLAKRKMGVLFVCSGNTCRSPMAEVVFRNILKANKRNDVIVASAGTSVRANEKISLSAINALKACGETVQRKPKNATQFTPNMFEKFDYIICMTYAHAVHLGRSHPNVHTLDEIAKCGDVADPFMQPLDTYIKVCKMLQDALAVLYKQIVK